MGHIEMVNKQEEGDYTIIVTYTSGRVRSYKASVFGYSMDNEEFLNLYYTSNTTDVPDVIINLNNVEAMAVAKANESTPT